MAKTDLSLTFLAVVFFFFACGPRPMEPRIAFSSGCEGDWEIYVMNAEGSGQINLTDNPSTDWFPACSPDGTRIAFISRPLPPTPDAQWERPAMNADGSGVTRLTSAPGGDGRPSWCGTSVGSRPIVGKRTCLLSSLMLESRNFASTSITVWDMRLVLVVVSGCATHRRVRRLGARRKWRREEADQP
ncbi:MAG TPA: hypothetical protein VMW58_04990 [Anaerolineae bacterium]|nr:hypothetical protein [Anaerolineae bacterium]